MIKTISFYGAVYSGEVNDRSIPHGIGTLKEADGNVRAGQWCNGKFQGLGIMQHNNQNSTGENCIEVGEWVDNTFCGVGARSDTPNRENRGIEAGIFKNGNLDGVGVMQYSIDCIDAGYWVDGCKTTSLIKIVDIEDSIYVGEINTEKNPNGLGVLIEKDGTLQRGYWLNGFMIEKEEEINAISEKV